MKASKILPSVFADFFQILKQFLFSLSKDVTHPIHASHTKVGGKGLLLGLRLRGTVGGIFWIYPQPRIPITTRIITFLLGDPSKPLLLTVAGCGVDPIYTSLFPKPLFLRIREFWRVMIDGCIPNSEYIYIFIFDVGKTWKTHGKEIATISETSLWTLVRACSLIFLNSYVFGHACSNVERGTIPPLKAKLRFLVEQPRYIEYDSSTHCTKRCVDPGILEIYGISILMYVEHANQGVGSRILGTYLDRSPFQMS